VLPFGEPMSRSASNASYSEWREGRPMARLPVVDRGDRTDGDRTDTPGGVGLPLRTATVLGGGTTRVGGGPDVALLAGGEGDDETAEGSKLGRGVVVDGDDAGPRRGELLPTDSTGTELGAE
jgi:hypothetical protein